MGQFIWLPCVKGAKDFFFTTLFLFSPALISPLATPSALRATVSLRLGHGAALTCHRHVIHYRAAAALPLKLPLLLSYLCQLHIFLTD